MGTRCKIGLYYHEYCPPEMDGKLFFPSERTFVYRRIDSFPRVIFSDLLELKKESEQEGNNDIVILAIQLFNSGPYYPQYEKFDARTKRYTMRNVSDYTYEVHIREKIARDKKPEWSLKIRGSKLEILLKETKFEDIRMRELQEL